MSWAERIYYQSPVVFQNALVSIMGLQLYRQRYGAAWYDQSRILTTTQSASREALEIFQMRALNDVLQFACRHVPFYKTVKSFPPIRSRADWNTIRDDIPIVDKHVLRQDPMAFVASEKDAPGRRFVLNTSGTSGTPLKIISSYAARQRHYAFWTRLREWYGVGASDSRATFFGRILMRSDQDEPPFWRYDLPQKNMLFSSYHMSDANLTAYYEQLRKFSPPEIIGYPSSLAILASFINKNSLEPLRPRVVFTTAETLLENQRAEMIEAFQAPVVNQYGCTEMVVFAAECAKGVMHIHPEHGLLEVVNKDGRAVEYGEAGEAVCTGFLNFAMPLIRYRLGDRVVLSDEPCKCGSHFPVIASIEGRVDDLLISPSGRPIPRLDPIFKGLRGIKETQIVQVARDRIVMKLSAEDWFTPADERNLIAEAIKRVGPEMLIDVERVEKIPRQANGKFRSVVRMPFDAGKP